MFIQIKIVEISNELFGCILYFLDYKIWAIGNKRNHDYALKNIFIKNKLSIIKHKNLIFPPQQLSLSDKSSLLSLSPNFLLGLSV